MVSLLFSGPVDRILELFAIDGVERQLRRALAIVMDANDRLLPARRHGLEITRVEVS